MFKKLRDIKKHINGHTLNRTIFLITSSFFRIDTKNLYAYRL